MYCYILGDISPHAVADWPARFLADRDVMGLPFCRQRHKEKRCRRKAHMCVRLSSVGKWIEMGASVPTEWWWKT